MFIQHWVQKPPLGVRINPAHPLSKGLVGYWLLHEGSGDKTYDLIQGDPIALNTMAFPSITTSGWNPGKNGVALAFDGSSDYVGPGPSYTVLGNTDTYTICIRVRLDNVTRVETPLSFRRNTLVSVNATDWRWQVLDASGTAIKSSFPRTSGECYDYCITSIGIAAGKTKLYTNGIHQDDGGDIDVIDEGALHLGVQEYLHSELGLGRYMLGLIEFAFLYANRALTAQEVLELHENPYGMFSWPMPFSVGAAPPSARQPRSPVMSGVPSAHF